MKGAVIHQLIDALVRAFEQLQADVSLREIEKLASMVHRVMTVQARMYHSAEHVFDLVDPASPIQSIAALFHDLVYYQVDLGIAPDVCAIVEPYIEENDGRIWLLPSVRSGDRLFQLTLDVFGFTIGQLPQTGANEFLSALFMNKRLEGMVQDRDLLRASVCIEATIPFRDRNESGETHFEVLEKRLHEVNVHYGLGLIEPEIEYAIQEAVMFANSDVVSFAEPDAGHFLDSTWKLLPEMNVALRSGSLYSLCDYRQALQRMDQLLWRLDPELIFHRYKGFPSQLAYRQMLDTARRNLMIGRQYLGVKMLAIAVLEALARVTGGDAPLVLFMGDVVRGGEVIFGLEDLLPLIPFTVRPDQAILFEMLDAGRAGDSYFDIRNSPTSLFIFKSLGPAGLEQPLEQARAMFDGRVEPAEFLKTVDRSVVSAIARAAAEIVVTRRQALLSWVEDHA